MTNISPFLLSMLLLISISATSCSLLKNSFIDAHVEGIYQASIHMEKNFDLEMFEKSMPAHLGLLENLHYQSPTNEKILALLIKGHTSYAIMVNETAILAAEWAKTPSEEFRFQALQNFTKCLEFGKKYLALKNIQWEVLLTLINDPQSLKQLLAKNLQTTKGSPDLEVLTNMAQALGSLISLQKDKVALLAQVPLVKHLFDWVCQQDGDINFGTCDLFYASYEAAKPRFLGGSPAKAEDLFMAARSKSPENWMIPILYLQTLVIPHSQVEIFDREMIFFLEKEQDFKTQVLNQIQTVESQGIRPYQALSIKRYKLMLKNKKNFFN